MIVQVRVGIVRVAITSFGVATPTSVTFFGASSVAKRSLVAVGAVAPRSAAAVAARAIDDVARGFARRSAPTTSLAAVATGCRPRRLPCRTTLLPLTVGGGRFLRRPRTIEQLLQLVERRCSHGTALSAMD